MAKQTKPSRKAKVFLTAAQKSEIIRLKRKGETAEELAGAYNVAVTTIHNICRNGKHRKTRTEVTAAMADEILELRAAGKSFQQIADLMGLGVSTVGRHLKKLGDPLKAHVGAITPVKKPVHLIYTDEGTMTPPTSEKADDYMDGLKLTLGIAAVLALVLLALGQAGVLQ